MNQEVKVHLIVRENSGKLLSFLRENLTGYPSVKSIKKAIEQRACKVNGQVVTFSTHPLLKGDKVVFAPIQKEQIQVKILHEDKYLLVGDKPPGVVCEDGIFQKYLPSCYRSALLIHRLDKDTSGLILLAKTAKVKEGMIALFKEHQVEKKYLALVSGFVKDGSGERESFIGKKFTANGQVYHGSVKGGKHALTLWEKVAARNEATLLSCQPVTGRTHQLRVHLSEMGHPIIGDLHYDANQSLKIFSRRHLLHAHKLSFVHPFTKEALSFTSNPPEDFSSQLKQLSFSLA